MVPQHGVAVCDGEADPPRVVLRGRFEVVLNEDVARRDAADERPRVAVIHHPEAERPLRPAVREQVVARGHAQRRAAAEREREPRERLLQRRRRQRRGGIVVGPGLFFVAHVARVVGVRAGDALETRSPSVAVVLIHADESVERRDERLEHLRRGVRERRPAVEHGPVPRREIAPGGDRDGLARASASRESFERPRLRLDDVVPRVRRVRHERRVRERRHRLPARRKPPEGDGAAALEASVAQREGVGGAARLGDLRRQRVGAVPEAHEPVRDLVVDPPGLPRRAPERHREVAKVPAEVDDVLHDVALDAGVFRVPAIVYARMFSVSRAPAVDARVGSAVDGFVRRGGFGVVRRGARVSAARGAARGARDVGECAAGVDDDLERPRGDAERDVSVVVSVLAHGAVQRVRRVRGGGVVGGGVLLRLPEEDAAPRAVLRTRERGVELGVGEAQGARAVLRGAGGGARRAGAIGPRGGGGRTRGGARGGEEQRREERRAGEGRGGARAAPHRARAARRGSGSGRRRCARGGVESPGARPDVWRAPEARSQECADGS